jgi:hypothetical protein
VKVYKSWVVGRPVGNLGSKSELPTSCKQSRLRLVCTSSPTGPFLQQSSNSHSHRPISKKKSTTGPDTLSPPPPTPAGGDLLTRTCSPPRALSPETLPSTAMLSGVKLVPRHQILPPVSSPPPRFAFSISSSRDPFEFTYLPPPETRRRRRRLGLLRRLRREEAQEARQERQGQGGGEAEAEAPAAEEQAQLGRRLGGRVRLLRRRGGGEGAGPEQAPQEAPPGLRRRR